MLDLKWITENETLLRQSLKSRNNFPTDALDRVLSNDVKRRDLILRIETMRSRRNQLAKDIGTKKRTGEDVTALMQESSKLNGDMESIDKELLVIQASVDTDLLVIPNVLNENVPSGSDAEQNVKVREWGEPTKFNFPAADHHDLGVKLGILDFDRATRMSSTRFSALLGKGARLERALIQFMLDLHTETHGYTEIATPFLVNSKALTGTTQLPKFREDLFKLEGVDLFLIPTAEVPVTNFYREEILEEACLPVKFVAFSPCFRSEAGSYGRDTKGLIRQHQFQKVELVTFAHPDHSQELHEQLTGHAEEVLKRLELPFRTMLLCSGDTSFGSGKTYDIEVWLPAQNTFREISSCSNFFDFQARRSGIRFKPKDGGKPRAAHTINGSGLAVGRTLVAILENYQEADGSVRIPKALQKYTGFDRIEARK